jgi:N-acyl-D-aspartate/D-glutamate deacylase
MPGTIDTLIIGARIIDGSGAPSYRADVAIADGRIQSIGDLQGLQAASIERAAGLVLSPGFIDAHAHDDLAVLSAEAMWPKLSQGITTVIVGNCGISAAPVVPASPLPDPLSILGAPGAFIYPTFAAYVAAIARARPAVNVAAFVGHTALRQNHLDRLDRAATGAEIAAMRAQLAEALDAGALGLSTGLAYPNAISAPTSEVSELARSLGAAKGIYATHLRDEFGGILEAIDEAVRTSRHAQAPLVISHLKCAGSANWGRIREVLGAIDEARRGQEVGCDCYPYTASSSLLDVGQVADGIAIQITWSTPHPGLGGRLLSEIAAGWQVSVQEAARRLQPAGAVYHCMCEEDVRAVLRHPATAIGTDGLPCDPRPHPRLWGAFPRVLGHYCRDQGLFPLPEAVHRMTGLTAARFGLEDRGLIREGAWADLVLFDPASIRDTATYAQPQQAAEGIDAVWVNGTKSAHSRQPTGQRAGRFVPRSLRPDRHHEDVAAAPAAGDSR